MRRGQTVHLESKSVVAEAYRTIRTAVFFGAPKEDAKAIHITSPAPGDGKSTLVSNLAIAMAQGLPKDGLIFTIEVNEEMESFIHEYISKSGLERKIKLLMGDALEIIPTLEEEFDLVFIDADKEQYVDYYKLAKTKLKRGGFIIADNVLWSGKVIEKSSKTDKETQGIAEFNEFVKNDSEVEQLMLSIRDGLMLIRKV